MFLGIEKGIVQGVFRLPANKLRALKEMLGCWRGLKLCLKEELTSLNRLLAYASKVVKESRIFLHTLIDLEKGFDIPDHEIRVNVEVMSEHTITLDVSRSWGCRIFGYTLVSTKVGWHPHRGTHIIKKLIPIPLAVVLQGFHCREKSVTYFPTILQLWQ